MSHRRSFSLGLVIFNVPSTFCSITSPSTDKVAVSDSCKEPSSLSPGIWSTISKDRISAPACMTPSSDSSAF